MKKPDVDLQKLWLNSCEIIEPPKIEEKRMNMEALFAEMLKENITWRECLPEAIALNSAEITNGE